MRILHPTVRALCLVAGAVRWAAVPRAAGYRRRQRRHTLTCRFGRT